MNQAGTRWIALGALLAGIAVITGAFAAHGMDKFCVKKYGDKPAVSIAGMEQPISYKRLNDFKTGARYQMYHALGLIAIGLLLRHQSGKTLHAAAFCFLFGILLFSGCLYALVFTGIKFLGAIVPIGGVLMILGWVLFAWGACSAGTRPPLSDE